MSAATCCAGCTAAFTFLDKGHLCRSCNNTFCARCSSNKRPLPSKGYRDPVRVCDVCLHTLDAEESLLNTFTLENNNDNKSNRNSKKNGQHQQVWTETQAAEDRLKTLKIISQLRTIYKAKIKPLEDAYHFSEFYATSLNDGDFNARPMILLVGQYSVGKTSFIQYLLERDLNCLRIGPEPTTDRFVAVMKGGNVVNEQIIPGNAAAVDIQRPFTSLTKFGTAFLNRFQICEIKNRLLDNVTLIDTPGILSGDKQRIERGYDFETVIQWFAERSDRILILFDAHKLDISDELKRVIQVLKDYDDKIRIVLNKADMIGPQQLLRVYGALMWSLGKVIRSPEVLRVYLGSFWNEPLNERGRENEKVFEKEREDLLNDLKSLPKNAAIRKINELVKRARLAKVHALLVSHLKSNMPVLWGHKQKQARLAMRLEEEYAKVQRAHNVAIGDFPPVDKFKSGLNAFDLSDFPSLSKRLTDIIDIALARDIPQLMLSMGGTNQEDMNKFDVDGRNPFEESKSPFESGASNGVEDMEWAVSAKAKAKWDKLFYKLNPEGDPPGLGGTPAVRQVMLDSGLAPMVLKKVWDLSDVDADGRLDEYEFALAMQLIKIARDEGVNSVPDMLPPLFIPPGKRWP